MRVWYATIKMLTGTACGAVLISLLTWSVTAAETSSGGGNRDLLPPPSESASRYAGEYSAINYAATQPTGAVAELQEQLERGEALLEFNERNGYLLSLLKALDIDVTSQILVFSRTSINAAHIAPETPRAIYFNDDVYVAWVPGAMTIEIATMDPALGPVFFELQQGSADAPAFSRQGMKCLRCHDSRTLTGGGVPRLILGTGYVGEQGNLLTHEGWALTHQGTPLKYRWGGWYVTGRHGDAQHLGNIIFRNAADLSNLDGLRVGSVDSLEAFVDTARYASNESDIVALLVIEHQVQVQNLITRIDYTIRSALSENQAPMQGERNTSVSIETKGIVESAADSLLKIMLFSDVPALTSPIKGSTTFASRFENRGPYDSRGRSLRIFDLEKKIFRYPLSYLVYSDAFDALPVLVRRAFYRRLNEALRGEASGGEFVHLSPHDRRALFEILMDTKPDFASVIQKLEQGATR